MQIETAKLEEERWLIQQKLYIQQLKSRLLQHPVQNPTDHPAYDDQYQLEEEIDMSAASQPNVSRCAVDIL